MLLIAVLAGLASAQITGPGSACGTWGANWLTCSFSAGKLAVSATPGQSSHQVIGTCGTATSFGPCSLTASDLPAAAGGGPPGGVAAITAATSTITTTETTVVSYTVPANTIAAGTTYRIVGYGFATSSAANSNDFFIRFGSTGTSSDTAIETLAITSATSGTSIPFRIEFIVTFRGTSVSEVAGVLNNNTNTGIYTGTVGVGGPTNTTGLTTTANEVLQLSYVSGASSTSTIWGLATIELVKP